MVYSAAHLMDPWCSGQTCGPVKAEIAGSNPVGSAKYYKTNLFLDENAPMVEAFFWVRDTTARSIGRFLLAWVCELAQQPDGSLDAGFHLGMRTGIFDAEVSLVAA